MIRPQPSNLWVFIDENPDSVNDAAYAVAMAQSLWQDGPSTYHGGGCGFSFADGHSEIKKWKDGRTLALKTTYRTSFSYGIYQANNFSCTSPLPTNGVGNITGHPLFMDMAADDFRLREESPCIDAGTNLMGFPMKVWRYVPEIWDFDWVVVGHITDPTDMLGNTRFIDGNFDGTVAWDMGAYEFNSFKPPQFTCAPQRMPDCWRLSITGAPNKWVHVQKSSDLRNWEDCWSGWMGAAGVKQVDDGDLSQKAMFYRAVVEQ
ncbi:MAG: hypothetical protein V9H26_01505 [Verrucomicrobiota bacterium]|nr:hypothetical protein [Verrucomicrobiota bacterium]MCC6821938.1 hypothetical protein [Limisphaerales bacterium]